jgi:hypothetical protein
MALLCACPAAAAIPDIELEDCKESIGQIQKILFQRVYSAAGTLNSFTIASANPNLLASWTPKLAASNGTKVVQTPFLSGPTTEPGAARKYGGGNATLGGIEIIVGREPTTFTAMFLETSQISIKDMKAFMCENVGVFFIDEFGRIIGKSDDIDTPTIVYPIPINGLFIGDKKFGGLEEPDSNTLEFGLYPNWSDDLYVITPTDFDALTELVTP